MESSTVDLGPHQPMRRDTRFDQLTDVRNFVRRQMLAHPGVKSLSVDVTWSNGEIETLVFDEWVGYPVGTSGENWINKWKEEVTREH